MNAQSARTKIEEALAGPGQHLGDVVWISTSAVHILRSELRKRLISQGLPDSQAPEDPKPQTAFGSAVTGYREGHSRFFLRRSERGKKGGEVLVVRQNESKAKPFDLCATMSVTEGGTFKSTQESDWTEDANSVLSAVEDLYNDRLDYVNNPELSGMIVDTLLNWCGGIRLRERGNIYWCQKDAGADLRALAKVIDGIGSSYMAILPVHDTVVYVCEKHGAEMSPKPGECGICHKKLVATKEARNAVARAATESFEAELRAVFEELAKFANEDSAPRPSTLERRLEDFEDLRNRVDLYSDILDNQKGKLVKRLGEATKQVREMLSADAA